MDAVVSIKISPQELKRLEAAVAHYRQELSDNIADEQMAPGSEKYQETGQDLMYLDSILRAIA